MDAGLRRKLLDAVQVALGGDWQAAHLVAQDHEDEPLANWLHAIVHRMEGDLGNAGYWYARCGRKLPADVSTDGELRELSEVLRAPGAHHINGS
jgi:hypothetical protein